jgi:serine/threonine-protein kinase
MGENRQGEYICSRCQADPAQIVQRLLKRAKGGDENLVPLKGCTIVKELGRGGMGAVYLLRNSQKGELVALKVMLPKIAADQRAKEKFLREVENTKTLKHTNVVRLQDSGCSEGTFFFTLEFCDGGSVDKLVKEHGGTLPITEAMTIILQALDGLEYAHNVFETGNGLVHRDLKPHNIFLSGSGSSRISKVGDYGLAKAFDMAGLSGQTRTGAMAGTPVFMPRQLLINFKYAKPEVDVWGMAASLYYTLAGRPPRDFPKNQDWWRVVLETPAVPIRKRDTSIPRKLAEVIDTALIDNPAIVFKTAAEFKRALEQAG